MKNRGNIMKKDPNACFVNLLYKCNNNCISCIREERNKTTEDPHLNKILNKINKILEGYNHIEFNGGEPTLRKDLFNILKYTKIKKPSAEVALLTNCRLFSNENYVKRLREIIPMRFKIVTTIYGHNPALHDAITKTPLSFEQQIKGIRNLIKYNIKTELRIVINKINYRYLDKIAKYVAASFHNSVVLNVSLINLKLYGIAQDNEKKIAYHISDVIEQVNKVSHILKEKGFNVKLFHFPYCVLPRELWKHTTGKSAEETQLIYPTACKRCTERGGCSGIWKGYYNLFGGKEFKPIK